MFRNKVSISDYYRQSLAKAKSEILRESDAAIIGTNTEELTQYYFDKYCLQTILFDETQEITWDPKKYMKTIYEHERDLDFEYEKIDVEIPIIQNENIKVIAELQSSTFFISFSEKEFSFTPNKITFSLETKGYGFSLNEDQIPQNLNSQIDKVKQLISWKNKDIKSGNTQQKNETVLLHGDFWPGNTLWQDGRLVAVIDWEDAALGDPVSDLANCRLEILWAFGIEAMEDFTKHYKSRNKINFASLPYWDLCAALKPCGKLAKWGLEKKSEQAMIEKHKLFVSNAIKIIDEP